jgi:cytochrome c556
MHRTLLTLAAAICTVCGYSLAALAETTPENAYEYRQAVMTSLRGHIGAASKIVRGQVDNDGFLVKHAQGLANGASELGHIFQEGSNVEGSEALPVIWEDEDAFAAAIEKVQTATAAFVEIAASGDKEAIGAGFREVGMSCRGCHDNFRVAQD